MRFAIPVYSLEAGPYDVSPTNNDFYFEINGEAITRVNFKDERLRIDGKALEMRFWNPEQPMRYVKQ